MLAATKLLASSRILYRLSAPSATALVGLTHLNAPGAVIMRATALLCDGGAWLDVTTGRCCREAHLPHFTQFISVNRQLIPSIPQRNDISHSIAPVERVNQFTISCSFTWRSICRIRWSSSLSKLEIHYPVSTVTYNGVFGARRPLLELVYFNVPHPLRPLVKCMYIYNGQTPCGLYFRS